MWSLLKETAASWSNHKAARLGAALAYYSIFSLGLLIVIAVAIAGFTFGQEAVRGEVGAQLQDLLGEAGAQAVNAMLVGASRPMEGTLATVLGLQGCTQYRLGGRASQGERRLAFCSHLHGLAQMGAEFTRVYAKRRAHGHTSAGDHLVPQDDRVDDYVHVAVRRSPYVAAIMALLLGWLFGRFGDRNQRIPRTSFIRC